MTVQVSVAPGARVVLDTNTVLALWLFSDPALAALQAAIEGGRLVLLTRADCLEELRHTLRYPHFKADALRQLALLEAYGARSLLCQTSEDCSALPRCRDSDDQKFLETAWSGGAQFLLSRDKAVLRSGRHRLYKARFTTLTPEAFNAALLGAAQ